MTTHRITKIDQVQVLADEIREQSLPQVLSLLGVLNHIFHATPMYKITASGNVYPEGGYLAKNGDYHQVWSQDYDRLANKAKTINENHRLLSFDAALVTVARKWRFWCSSRNALAGHLRGLICDDRADTLIEAVAELMGVGSSAVLEAAIRADFTKIADQCSDCYPP